MTTPIQVRYTGGIHLPEPDLWLDPPRRKTCAFVSHAHSDHFARHDWTLCSEPTARLVSRRYGEPRGRTVATLAFHEPLEWNGFVIELLPAGHILGSAMLHLTRLSDGASLLYTGDFKLRHGLTAEPAFVRQADTLIMETTFGRPQFRFPSRDHVIAGIHQFVQTHMDRKVIPVLLGYSLGKAQEILASLRGGPWPIMVHDAALDLMDAFHEHGCVFPTHRPFDPGAAAGHVLVLPPNAARTPAVRSLPAISCAMLSGWALMKGAKYRYGVDEVLPLSDHADYDELLQCVELTRPSRIFTVHGYTTDFARDLRARGFDAWSLVENEQMELQFPPAEA